MIRWDGLQNVLTLLSINHVYIKMTIACRLALNAYIGLANMNLRRLPIIMFSLVISADFFGVKTNARPFSQIFPW